MPSHPISITTNSQTGGGIRVNGGTATLTDTLFISNVADEGGGADGSGLTFINCTMKYNTANGVGGAFSGGADLDDCVLIGNDATNGGAAYAESRTTFIRCIIAEGTASQQGAAAYSAGTSIKVRDSLVRGFAADASGGATTLVYADGSLAVAVLDRVSWSNNELGAAGSANDAIVVVRNNEGLAPADVQEVALLRCDDAAIGEYCSLATECTDSATGIACYCSPDGVKTDPDLGACLSSASFSNLVLGSEETQLLLLNKDDGIATTSLFWPNSGGVPLVWNLAVTKNADDLWCTFSSGSGTLAPGSMQEVVLSLDLTDVHARKGEYHIEFTLNTSSPTPTPVPISSTTTVVVSVVVSASASANTSVVTMTNLAHLTASGMLEFTVDSADAAGVPMLDVSDVIYVGELSAESTNVADVITCGIIYSNAVDHHVGTCAMPALSMGGFALKVLLGSKIVGGSTHHFSVDSCPDSYVPDDGGGSCTCAAGQYELADAACVACADNHAKPSLGTDKADCKTCQTILGETSNAAHTACDACIAGFYNKGNTCVQCPDYPTPCVESSVLMPGYWRAATGDGDAEVLPCRFGDASCPGNEPDSCLSRKWHHCTCGYAGPTCAVCDSNDADSRFYMAWTSGKFESCDDGMSHAPTIGLACGLVAFVLLIAALAFTKRKHITSSRTYQRVSLIYRIGRVKFAIILFAFQVIQTQRATSMLSL